MTPDRDPRIYFAAERTMLAWIRTGLAMMGFGFVVARFGLFLRELAVARGETVPNVSGSLWAASTSDQGIRSTQSSVAEGGEPR